MFKYMLMASSIFLAACTENTKEDKVVAESSELVEVTDVHSYAHPNEAVVTHLDLDVDVDFDNKQIAGVAHWTIDNNNADSVFFDIDDLNIEKIVINNKVETSYSIGKRDKILGSKLAILVQPQTEKVSIYYHTSPGSKALQWLSPEQTFGKTHPFLFTQSQAILARTWIPCQDSPGIRYTYNAKVRVPKDLLALMSANNPQQKSERGEYEFTMDIPIPSYLMALSVGDIAFTAVSNRTGIYAEPGMLSKAKYEFADMETMVQKAEALYGPYAWGRYDLIVLPPSFPFGGMENPKLTFATPTILAGDRSLVALVAHELAHSWSGNLVTNQTWNDFWLNEGFTVYFEMRIMEAVYGRDYSEMLAMISHEDMKAEVEEIMANHPEDTRLKLDLAGRDPDDGMSAIAYDKGYHFLRLCEETVGREKWDVFLKNYFQGHKFQVMNTEQFLTLLNDSLLSDQEEQIINIDAWVYQNGLPENCPVPQSDRFAKVEEAAALFEEKSYLPKKEVTNRWSSHEWLHFIRSLPTDLTEKQLNILEYKYKFSKSGNNEILAAWWQPVIRNKYERAYPKMEKFLINVGRRKFLTPTYRALVETNQRDLAVEIYTQARPNYHSVSRGTMDVLLGYEI
jgi:leukotriene A-4 hydrolase/aminopeptidase